VYVNGTTSNNTDSFFEVKYSTGLSSVIFKKGPVLDDGRYIQLEAATVDLQGNTYATGGIGAPNAAGAAFIMKRNSAGDLVYLNTFQDPDPSDWGYNIFSSVAVDTQGNPYVVNFDYSVSAIKYDFTGNVLWSIKPFNNPLHLATSGIDLDGHGNIYTVGSLRNWDTGWENTAVMKYSATTADTTPPAAVSNLAATVVSSNSITLSWTAPGDDGIFDTASAYDLRYTIAGVITSSTDFNSASQTLGEPVPQAAGSAETFVVTGLTPGTTYFFALITTDESRPPDIAPV